MIQKQFQLNIHDGLIVVLFAGGGGMCEGIERGTGRCVDLAVNHNPDALDMHLANHPHTRHLQTDVRDVDPVKECGGRPVAYFHMSPDCTDHSQSKAGQPRDQATRSLTWIGLRWMGKVRPEVFTLENVKQIEKWGPLIAKRCSKTGRAVKIDGTVAEPGERIPRNQQWLISDPRRRGLYWTRFLRWSKELFGYDLEVTIDRACNFGAPTIRERLFLIARCDGRPIVRPIHTHARKGLGGLKPWREAWECMDFNVPTRSIFTRRRPLAVTTQERIAKGIVKEVLTSQRPFLIPLTHHGDARVYPLTEPMPTITGAHRGEIALCAPTLVGIDNKSRNGSWPITAPLTTITGEARHAMVMGFLAQMNGGNNTNPGHSLHEPMSTISTKGAQQQLVTGHLAHFRNNCSSRSLEDPLQTISARGEHHALVECTLSSDVAVEKALRVAAFLMRYHATGGQWASLHDPMTTITTKERLALVTVTVFGYPMLLVDIGLRMLMSRELFRAQGFHDDYIIDRGASGKVFSKGTQVLMVGNSVSPDHGEAIVSANCSHLSIWNRRERMLASA